MAVQAEEPEQSHWAQDAIDRLAAVGLIASGTDFDPDAFLTRADACVILDRLVRFQAKMNNRFTDLPDGTYYTDAMLRIGAAGILYIPAGDMIYPELYISRELAFSMLYKLFRMESAAYDPGWTDADLIGYNAAVSAFAAGGYIPEAMTDGGYFLPERPITRAEFATVISNYIELFADYEQVETQAYGNVLCKSLPDGIFATGKIYVTESRDYALGNVIYLQGWDGANLNEIDYPYLLASFTTSFDAGSWARTNNIRIASENYISGTTLAPGATFSFNSVVGPRTAAKGYGTATIFVGAEREQGIGGGVCQVSTTLFNAALLSNMTIAERHQHSMKITYVDPGRDATVYQSQLDFKFTNSLDVPVIIKMSVDGGAGTCTASICAAAPVSLPEVSLKTERSGNTYSLYRYADGQLNYSAYSRY